MAPWLQPAMAPVGGRPANSVGQLVGYWGPTTSTLDWCEKNYEVTYYMAEFWNTVTNLAMILPALIGIYESRKQGLELRYSICFGFFLLVGIGSWLFHMTLMYEMQLMDELPMVWGAAYMYYCLEKAETKVGDTQARRGIGLLMFLYSLIVSVVYISSLQNPLFHEGAYGLLVFMTLIKAIRLQRQNGKFIKVPLFYLGCFLYTLGFILWNIDNHFCPRITQLRDSLRPAPTTAEADSPHPLRGLLDLSPLTQLHGWWHLLAGYGTYVHIVFCIHNRLIYLNLDCSLVPSWLVGVKITNNNYMKKSVASKVQ